MTLPGLTDPTDTPPEGLSADEVKSQVTQFLQEAKLYRQTVLQDHCLRATDYYLGRPFGNGMEVDGRSQFVVPELHDTIQAILPDMVEVFSGSERTVEFRARMPEDVPGAEQATDLVGYIVNEENPGPLTRYTAFKDAFLRRLGVVKAWWEPGQPTLTDEHLSGVSLAQLTLLNNDEAVQSGEVLGTNRQPDGSVLFDVDVKYRSNPRGRVLIEAVPSEEFVFSPNAKSLQDALCVAHVTRLRRSDLMRMGYGETDIDEAGLSAKDTDLEFAARQPQGIVQGDANAENPWVDYAEVYCYLDENGDGVAEHRRVVVLGQGTVVADEAFEGRPFALYFTDPEPHSIVPSSVADSIMPLQLLKSVTLRSILDSGAQTNNPGLEVVEGQVNMTDVMNKEVGRVLRVRQPGMVRDLVTPFVGKELLPLLAVADEMKENSTGVSKAAAGLNPDALQSSTKAAVAATVTGSQRHLRLMARMLAEGEKQLYKLVLKLTVQHQDRAKVIRLRNQYVEVDPRTWDAEMDCVVNVGLGATTTEDRLNALREIAGHQQQILLQLGPTNPLCGLGQYAYTLEKMTELAGFKDATKFWKAVDPNYEPPAVQPKPSPEEIYAQVEQAKLVADTQEKAARLDLDRQKLMMDDARLRDQMNVNAQLEAMKIATQTHAKVDEIQVKQTVAERPAPTAKE